MTHVYRLDGTTLVTTPWKTPKINDPEVYIITYKVLTELMIEIASAETNQCDDAFFGNDDDVGKD